MPRRSYEVDIMHPAAAQWLTEHGYEFEHEKRFPDGRVDFFAWNELDEYLVVECKIAVNDVKGTIRQLTGYVHQVKGNVFGAIALPTDKINERVVRLCSKAGMSIISLDVKIPEVVKVTIPMPTVLYEIIWRMAFVNNVSFGEMVRNIIANDPAMIATAEEMGIDIKKYQTLKHIKVGELP